MTTVEEGAFQTCREIELLELPSTLSFVGVAAFDINALDDNQTVALLIIKKKK